MATNEEIAELGNRLSRGPVITKVRGTLEVGRSYTMKRRAGGHRVVAVGHVTITGQPWTTVVITSKPQRVSPRRPVRRDGGFTPEDMDIEEP